jgi:hypothetical protein
MSRFSAFGHQFCAAIDADADVTPPCMTGHLPELLMTDSFP